MLIGHGIGPQNIAGDIEHQTCAQGGCTLSIQDSGTHLQRKGGLNLDNAERGNPLSLPGAETMRVTSAVPLSL